MLDSNLDGLLRSSVYPADIAFSTCPNKRVVRPRTQLKNDKPVYHASDVVVGCMSPIVLPASMTNFVIEK